MAAIIFRPRKFGFDARRAHLASLILSGQISRDDALSTLENDTENMLQAESEGKYIMKKLGISEDEFLQIMTDPPKTFRDYPSNYALFSLKARIRDRLKGYGINFGSNS